MERYILKNLLLAFGFYLALCRILSKLIGISCEQAKFVTEQDLPLKTVFLVYLLELPSSVTRAFPFALLIATIWLYSRLSSRNEVAALQSFGVSLSRLILPSLAIGKAIAIVMSAVGEAIISPANDRAAMLLEKEWNGDRTNLAKYNNRNIIYQEFENSDRNSRTKNNTQQGRLHELFFAKSFNCQKMQGVTLIKYHNATIN